MATMHVDDGRPLFYFGDELSGRSLRVFGHSTRRNGKLYQLYVLAFDEEPAEKLMTPSWFRRMATCCAGSAGRGCCVAVELTKGIISGVMFGTLWIRRPEDLERVVRNGRPRARYANGEMVPVQLVNEEPYFGVDAGPVPDLEEYGLSKIDWSVDDDILTVLSQDYETFPEVKCSSFKFVYSIEGEDEDKPLI